MLYDLQSERRNLPIGCKSDLEIFAYSFGITIIRIYHRFDMAVNENVSKGVSDNAIVCA